MLRTQKPFTLIGNYMHDLQHHLPGVYDGAEASIHDARVALRRITEALCLVREEFDEHALAAIEARLGKATRALGRVRDADSGQHVIADVERRFPFAAATLGQLRAEFADHQYKSRRKAIKKLEALELRALPQQLARAWHGPGAHWPLRSHAWRAAATRHIVERANLLRDSIDHASGVYFSKRAHSTRIATKQLRYTLELAALLGATPLARAVRLLKKAQDVLGGAHDRDVLRDHLEALRRRDGAVVNAIEADALARFLRADTLSLHQRYANWRADLLAICDACLTGPRRGHAVARTAVIAGIGIPAFLLLSRNSISARTG